MIDHRKKIRRAVDVINTAEDAVLAARQRLYSAHVEFGRVVREAREAKKISLRQVATHLKLSAPYLSDVELGRRAMTPDNVEAYMSYLMPDVREEIRQRIQKPQ